MNDIDATQNGQDANQIEDKLLAYNRIVEQQTVVANLHGLPHPVKLRFTRLWGDVHGDCLVFSQLILVLLVRSLQTQA